MSKYNALWDYVSKKNQKTLMMTFDEIIGIAGVPIDHSFLNYKKELLAYGFQVGKISLKKNTVQFLKTE